MRQIHLAAATLVGAFTMVTAGVSHAATLLSSGPVVNGSGLSVVAASTYGFGMQASAGNSVADDFVVPAGYTWNVSDISFYSYQTGSTGFTFQQATWSVVTGGANGTVVASGTTGVTNGGLMGYRVLSTALTDTSRGIYNANADMADFLLGAGSYYLRWSMTGSLASGPWQPPTSDAAVGNAAQSISNGAFSTLVDSGTLLGVTLPFTINGTENAVSGIPEPGSLVGLGCVLATGLGFRSRRQRPLSA